MPGARCPCRLTPSALPQGGGRRGYPSTMASVPSARVQPSRLRAATGAFVTNWRNPELRRAQAAFFGAWTAEWSVTVALAGWAVFADGPALAVYALVTVSSAAAVLFRPVHSALLPSLCATPPELAGANVVRGALDSAATLVGPALCAILLATGGLAQVLAVTAVAS